MTHQQVKEIIRALTKRVELLEAMVGVPQPHNDFATPLQPGLHDSIPQFMEPNTRITN